MSVLALPTRAQQAEKQAGTETKMDGTQSSQPPDKLTRVEDHKKVCMVTNKTFPKDQIPIAVNGKTYYGCCAMCRDRLSSDAKARTGTDPVSKKPVDKADAMIAADADGRVFYFENEDNLATYNAKRAKD